MQVQFVKKSSNGKIGTIPCTTTSRDSCPNNCKLKGQGGCYAEAGYYTRLNWNKVDSGERGSNWASLCRNVAALPDGQVWRHNVAGDLPHDNQKISKTKLLMLSTANSGKLGFTYTHHSMKNKHNRDAVLQANRMGFAVNLSADDPEQADKLAALDIAPVVTILPESQKQNTKTPQGRQIVVCPAETHEGVTCETCKLCAIPDRSVIIGFPAHGSRKNRIAINQIGV